MPCRESNLAVALMQRPSIPPDFLRNSRPAGVISPIANVKRTSRNQSDGTVDTKCAKQDSLTAYFVGLFLGMKKKDLTAKQISSVECPTCGMSVGRRCILASGGLRFSPHVNRKLAAAEAMEAKRTPVLGPEKIPVKG
jgi:hypothetical protein